MGIFSRNTFPTRGTIYFNLAHVHVTVSIVAKVIPHKTPPYYRCEGSLPLQDGLADSERAEGEGNFQ